MILLIIAGIICGAISGMGIGGGTVLIAALTIFYNMGQLHAQGISLIAFIPAAVLALITYFSSKMIKARQVLPMCLAALPASVLGAILASYIGDGILRKLFGGMLMIVAIWQLVVSEKRFAAMKRDAKEK